MKIAFVANTSWNIYNFRKGLVHFFMSRGDEVLMLTPKDEYTDKVANWGVKWYETPLDGTGLNPLQDLNYLLKLKSIFNKEKPEAVLGYTIKANIYSCLASYFTPQKIICNVSGLGTVFLVPGLAGKIALWLYQIAFKKAAFVFFQNRDDQTLFTSKIELPPTKTGLLPGSGINLETFTYSLPEFKKPIKILMIARLIIEKGVQEFAEAAALFENNEQVSFTLIGKFDAAHSRSVSKADLEHWIARGWITYLPHSDDVKQIMDMHEVVILPSYREGTPRTLLEAAALGRPLLASNVPGCKEVVEDGKNGYLFEVRSASNIAEKIQQYLSISYEEKKRMSQASRSIVEQKFDEKLVFHRYSEVINEITTDS